MRTAEDYVQVRTLLQTFHCLLSTSSNEPTCEVAGQNGGLGLVDWEKVGEMAQRGEEGAVDEGKLP